MSLPILLTDPAEIALVDDFDEAGGDDDSLELLRQWLPSWLCSLVGHLVLVLLLALVSIAGEQVVRNQEVTIDVQAGGGGGDGGDDLLGSMSTSSELLPALTQTPVSAVAPAELPPQEVPAIGVSDIFGTIAVPLAGDGVGHGTGSGEDEGTGPGAGGGPGGPGGLGTTRTSVFGLSEEGSTFVYVFDRSGSMNATLTYTNDDAQTVSYFTTLDAAKAELLKSLARLGSQQRFHLLFYNQQSWLFDSEKSSKKLFVASPENKTRAAEFVASVSGDGSTNHMDALETAIRMRPEVIFLLSDGEPKDDLTPAQLKFLRTLNRRRTRINVIQFIHGTAAPGGVVQLAKENGGQHTFINIATLAHLLKKLPPPASDPMP